MDNSMPWLATQLQAAHSPDVPGLLERHLQALLGTPGRTIDTLNDARRTTRMATLYLTEQGVTMTKTERTPGRP